MIMVNYQGNIFCSLGVPPEVEGQTQMEDLTRGRAFRGFRRFLF